MTASVMIRTCLLTETTETFDIDEHNTYYLLNVWCPVLNISVQNGSVRKWMRVLGRWYLI